MNEDNKRNILPISGLLLLLAALGFFRFTELPFTGPRPNIPEVLESEKVKARLWQDPFMAVMAFPEKGVSPRSAGNFGLLQFENKMEDTKTGKCLKTQIADKSKECPVTVLGVMVFGSPYAEETEDRVRRRHAVLTALGKAGYVPDDPEHIDFIRVGDYTGKPSISTIMPFEWFSLISGGHLEGSVLVLWINDNVFNETPLCKLRGLVDCLALMEGDTLKKNIAFKIIGPAGSTRLEEMLNELENRSKNSKEPQPNLKGVEIYSATATIDDSLLLKREYDQPGNSGQVIVGKFKNRGVAFSRTIASDGELAKGLLDELELRRAVPRKGNDCIMLVTEWDTLYARSLLGIYRKIFGRKIRKDRLIAIHYMRGIDGSLPGKEEEKKENDKSGSGEAGAKVVKLLERPIGEAQYDYLRRLADEAYELKRKLGHGGSVKAIGVLGSDFYDKYLVLQAFRQKFPDAVFFTTDLDARLLHPDNIEWTRNMVVASSYGLNLQGPNEAKEGPEEIPLSFRSNYQTSIYTATLQAIASGKPVTPDFREEQRTRIFEIGHHSAVDLSALPSWGLGEVLRSGLIIAGFVSLSLLLLCFTSSAAQKSMQTVIYSRTRLVFLTMAALVLAFISFSILVIHSPGEEPFSLYEGVSIWPTEILRLVALVLSITFLQYSSVRLRNNSRDIANQFILHPPKGGKYPNLRDILGDNWDLQGKGNRKTIAELWKEYQRQDSLPYRLFRLAPVLILYFGLCAVIIFTFGKPVTPVRGRISGPLDRAILICTVVSFVILNFYIFDVTRTFRRFVDLARELPDWSNRSLKKFCSPNGHQETIALKEWMLIRLIAMRSDVLGKLIFFPFITWLILFIARFRYFDNWYMPPGLVLIISLGAVYAWSSAFMLRRSAERARATAIQRLTERRARTLMENGEESRIMQIQFALDEIKSNRQGAFAQFSQHPILQALFIPFGGVGGMYFIDFITKINL